MCIERHHTLLHPSDTPIRNRAFGCIIIRSSSTVDFKVAVEDCRIDIWIAFGMESTFTSLISAKVVRKSTTVLVLSPSLMTGSI